MNTMTQASAHTEPVKLTFYSACRASALGACLLMGATTAHAALMADGRLSDGEGYTSFYWVDFPDALQDGSDAGWVGATGVGSGLLALGTDATTGNHFMYYALPKGYVDNTYESTGNDIAPIVGTYEGSSGHQLGTGLIGSDNFGNNPFELYYTNPTNADYGNVNISNCEGSGIDCFRFTVDYLADVKTDGTRTDIMSAGGGGGVDDTLPIGASQWGRNDGNNGNLDSGNDNRGLVIEIATSMEWNIDNYGPTGTGNITADDIANLTGYLANSPDVVRQIGGIDDGLAILAADGYSYQSADALFQDWIYEVAYEFEFDASLFGAEWTDGTLSVEELMKLPIPHASPNKGLNGQGDIFDPVFTPVPVPAAVWLFGSGLLGLVGIARRRKTA